MGFDIVCKAESARSTCPQISSNLFPQHCIYSSFNNLLDSRTETLPVSSSRRWQFRLSGRRGRAEAAAGPSTEVWVTSIFI